MDTPPARCNQPIADHGFTAARARSRRLPGYLAAIVAVTVALASAGLVVGPARALDWAVNSFSAESESQLIALTNQARAAAGLPALKKDSVLTDVARWRSKDMIVRDYFSHEIPPPNGGVDSVFAELSRRGYCFQIAGENIGWNTYPDDVATQAIQDAFMNSSGHRANILGKAWDVIGVGAYKGPNGKKMWTVLFADKCGATAPTATPKPTPVATPKPTPKPSAPKTMPLGQTGQAETQGKPPVTAKDLVEQGKQFYRTSKLPQALKKFTDALKLEADNDEALGLAAITAFRLGNYEQSRELFGRRLALEHA
ncbi:MAG: hypothetical protein C4343_03265, partial [Chloroflexota bacterium]